MREAALARRGGHPTQGRRHREGGGRGELEDQKDRGFYYRWSILLFISTLQLLLLDGNQ